MTILFLARRFYPSIGGVEKHVLEVSKRLVAKGHKVIVLTEEAEKNPDANKNNKIVGIEIIRMPYFNQNKLKKFRIWNWLYQHRELIEQADIIHCHDVFIWYLPFRFIFPKKPVYTTFHGYEGYPVSKKAIIIRKISEKLSKGNICVGEFINKWYGTKPNFITYGGTEINQKSKIKSQKFISQLKIYFIGRLESIYGIEIYLKALETLKEKHISFTFEAFGDGNLRQNVSKIGKVNGFLADISQAIEKADIVFVSSYLSILQTLAAKKLVFAAYDNPLKKDYLEMTPFKQFIIIVSNPKELAEKIQYYLNNPREERKLVSEGYEWVKKQSWDEVVNLYEKLWRS